MTTAAYKKMRITPSMNAAITLRQKPAYMSGAGASGTTAGGACCGITGAETLDAWGTAGATSIFGTAIGGGIFGITVMWDISGSGAAWGVTTAGGASSGAAGGGTIRAGSATDSDGGGNIGDGVAGAACAAASTSAISASERPLMRSVAATSACGVPNLSRRRANSTNLSSAIALSYQNIGACIFVRGAGLEPAAFSV